MDKPDPNKLQREAWGDFLESLDRAAKDRQFTKAADLLRAIERESSLGERGANFAHVFKGFNRRVQGNALPANSDNQGLVFFTRPDLNLSHDNLAQLTTMTPLLTNRMESYQSAIRHTLDPRGMSRLSGGWHPIIDHRQAFIPILSNTMTTQSGWPDILVNASSGSEGIAKEQWMMNDSISEIYRRWSLTCEFKNFHGNPIMMLFAIWIQYMGAVYTGKMYPHVENLVHNRIDYMTRIYRFTLDQSMRYITGMACTGVAMPTAINIGAMFNYNRENSIVRDVDRVSMSFECLGAIYNDPRYMHEFNRTTLRFHREMSEGARRSSDNKLIKVDPWLLKIANYRGYPWINMRTSELEWWMYENEYRTLVEEHAKVTTDVKPTGDRT